MKGRREDSYESYTSTINSSYTEQGNQDECIGIDFSTQLKNIQTAFYSQKVGEVLEIKLENINVLKVYADDGSYCGNILSSYNGLIIKCLKKKRDFGVKIINMSGNAQVYNI